MSSAVPQAVAPPALSSTGTSELTPAVTAPIQPDNTTTTTEALQNNRQRTSSGHNVDVTGRRYLTVASSSPVKQVAGSIAHTTRSLEPPVLSAVGPSSVNQAVKAIAVARNYLENDNLSLFVEVDRPGSNSEIKDLLQFSLLKYVSGEFVDSREDVPYTELRSAGSTGTGQLAGAIAKSIRDGGRVRIKGIGADSVFRAVDAITYARTYLEPDGLDLRFQPAFVQVQFGDGNTGNAIQITVFSVPRE